MSVTGQVRLTDEMPTTIDISALYAEHGELVWKCLAHLGVREADLEDLLQEAFLVVYQQNVSFENDAATRGYLRSICRKLAANYRKRAFRRLETDDSRLGAEPSAERGPEQAALESEASAQLEVVLGKMSDEKRAAFIMFEIDLLPAEEIARHLGIPVGTVYSRIHSARADFEYLAKKLGSTR